MLELHTLKETINLEFFLTKYIEALSDKKYFPWNILSVHTAISFLVNP